MGHSEGSPHRENHSNSHLPREDRKISDKQHKPTTKTTRETTTNKTQNEQNEGNNQDQSRIKLHRD